MVSLLKLNYSNFEDFLSLLRNRGEAPEDYYRWKYLEQPTYGHPSGFIAYIDNKSVGCIGIINRMYRGKDGKDRSATWFADWFVNDTARGQRIGEALMREVCKTSDFNFGIPGPVKAQHVCKQANYKPIEGFVEHTLYIKPFRCGYKRFAGSGLKKKLRGLKNVLFSLSSLLKLSLTKQKFSLKVGFPDTTQWVKRYGQVSEKISFARNDGFLNWFKNMPLAPGSDRLWWSVDHAEVFACGFIETDFWGLRKVVIVDLYSAEPEKSLWEIAATLSKENVDWISLCYFDKQLTLKYWSRMSLPLHYSITNSIADFHFTSVDKDSSWRSFLFA